MADFIIRMIPNLFFMSLIMFTVLFFFTYWKKITPRKGTPDWVLFETEKSKSKPVTLHPLRKPDWLAMAAVTVVYAAVTFFYLGNTESPQSFYNLEYKAGAYLELELEEPTRLTRLTYFTGLNGNNHWGKVYKLDVSADGENWTALADLNRNYAATFRWLDADLGLLTEAVKYIRLIPDKYGGEIGELGLYDDRGERIDPASITVTMDGAVSEELRRLFDEQTLLPERRTILNGTYFDEIYHAYTAYEFEVGERYPYENTHPPLGKLTTLLGIKLFGMTPFGWRFFPALFGVLMLPFLYALIKNMFGKTFVAVCGTVIFAFDFMHFTQTRISTIDVYAVFWIILMYFFMYRWLCRSKDLRFLKAFPSLALCGLCFGFGAASKWTVFYAAAGLIVLYVWALARRYRAMKKEKQQDQYVLWLTKTILISLVFYVALPAVIYTASYIPYVQNKPVTVSSVWDACWANQKSMLNYHSNLNRAKVNIPEDGTIVSILVEKGQEVKANDKLAEYKAADGTIKTLTSPEDGMVYRIFASDSTDMRKDETAAVIKHGGHYYESRWYQWLFNIRPVYYFANSYAIKPSYNPLDDEYYTIEPGGILSRYQGPGGALVLPEYTREILPGAFAGADIVTHIYLPDEMKTVDPECLRPLAGAVLHARNTKEMINAAEEAGLTFAPYKSMRMSASAFNNPLVSWGGLIALISAAVLMVLRRKPIVLFILIGYFAQLFPWFAISRTTFAYHYFPSVIFLVLALCFCFDHLIDRQEKSGRRMTLVFTSVTVVLFGMFWPVLAAAPVHEDYVRLVLRWMSTWPI